MFNMSYLQQKGSAQPHNPATVQSEVMDGWNITIPFVKYTEEPIQAGTLANCEEVAVELIIRFLLNLNWMSMIPKE